MYQDVKNYPLAASHLEEALQIAPKSAHYWQLLGDVKLLEKNTTRLKITSEKLLISSRKILKLSIL